MKDLLPPPPKAYAGPHWIADARVGEGCMFGGRVWSISKVENRGRVIHWVCGDGRVARTECMPDHPQYPQDPTPAQLKQESLDRMAAKRREREQLAKAIPYGWMIP